jgi:hypothetical protein
MDAQKLWKSYPEYFEKTLVDVPCSMEGRFLASYEKSYKDWSRKKVKIMAQMQKFILRSAVSATKPGGTIVVWVYGYEGNEWIVRYVNPLRHVLVKLPPWVSDVLSYVLTVPVYLFVKIFPQTQPYYKQLSGFRFWHIRSIVFDQLLPKVANYWKRDEAQALFEGKGLTDISVYPVNGLSWTVIGKKK